MATDQVERVTNLLALLLEASAPLSATEIYDVLQDQYPANEVGRRGAFERDKRLLREQGIVVDQVVLGGERAGQTGYSVDRSTYELPELGLTAAETVALQVAVAMVRSEAADDAIWKVAAGGRGEPVAPALAASLPDLDGLTPLSEAAARRASVSFVYRDLERTLDPYAIASREGQWYVMGFDHQRGELRTYRIDRIQGGITVGVNDAFVRPEDFDSRALFPDDPKLLEIGGISAMTAVVHVGASSASGVRRQVGEAAVLAVHGDGSIDVEVPCRNLPAFRSWLFGVGDATVLRPTEVRADVIRWLSCIAEPVEQQ